MARLLFALTVLLALDLAAADPCTCVNDLCNVSCGDGATICTCSDGGVCNNGQCCYPPPLPTCFPGTCDSSFDTLRCGRTVTVFCTCDPGGVCNDKQCCYPDPVPICAPNACGISTSSIDSCGGTLTTNCTCATGGICNEGQCCYPKTAPTCASNSCGTYSDSDGCNGTVTTNCTCTTGGVCNEGQCCYPKTTPGCAPNSCGRYSFEDGCGKTVSYNCECPDGSTCNGSGKCCKNTCTTTVTADNGQKFTFDGVCATRQPINTVKGGPCSSGCGDCYVSSFDLNLCPGSLKPAGRCAESGKCGCFQTVSGASCSPNNFKSPAPSPLPGNGGGCSENAPACKAFAAQNGGSTACCPLGCK